MHGYFCSFVYFNSISVVSFDFVETDGTEWYDKTSLNV